jgi:muramoyltetrapeptide carboxypeptidase
MIKDDFHAVLYRSGLEDSTLRDTFVAMKQKNSPADAVRVFPEWVRRIGVIAPAGRAKPARVQAFLDAMEQQGIGVRIMPHVLSPEHATAPFAGSREQRIYDFLDAYRDESLDLLMAVRGGFGTAHLLPEIEWKQLAELPAKPVLGYSDLTALHLAMLRFRVGLPIATPMAVHLPQIESDPYTRDWLRWSLGDGDATRQYGPPAGHRRIRVWKRGCARGRAVPMNLSVLCSLVGTPYLPDFRGIVPLIEDVNEPPYVLDRHLTHLAQAGILSRIAGLVFGSFHRCGKQHERFRIFERITDVVNGPVLSEFCFGHRYPMAALPCGCPVQIDEKGGILFRRRKRREGTEKLRSTTDSGNFPRMPDSLSDNAGTPARSDDSFL